MLTLAALALVGLLASTAAAAWGRGLQNEQRLLPGTRVEGVDVGGSTVDEARALLAPVARSMLDREVALVHGDAHWSVSAEELGGSTDLDEVLAAAAGHTEDASLLHLTRLRFLGAGLGLHLEVSLELPGEELELLMGTLGDAIDVDPVDATARFEHDTVVTSTHLDGARLDRAAAREGVTELLLHGRPDGAPFALPVETVPAAVTSDHAHTVATTAMVAIDDALHRAVTVHYGDRRWELTPAELGAQPDGASVVAAVWNGDQPRPAFGYPDGAVEGAVADIAAAIDVRATSATGSWRGGRLHVEGERAGLAVDRPAAVAALVHAFAGAERTVELQTDAVGPALRAASFGTYLLVDQPARRVELRTGDQVVRSWPVAVGTGGSPTPTGTFVVGAKRYEPTWVNPARDRWGRDMPARIGPGPSNPLGLRALNWNRPGGGDTLIRFHGTPNEASIGQAASNGCVRMFNADVVELYDLVDVGTPIVSVG